jgi:hypothetical protein
MRRARANGLPGKGNCQVPAGDKVSLTQDVSIVANLARVVAYYNYTVHPPMSAPMQAHQWVVVGSVAETALVTTHPTAHGGLTITLDPSLVQPI